jgi:putative hydrolase of the HAD superfamily
MAQPDSVRAVLFDAVGTLIQARPDVIDVYFAAGRRFGADLDLDEIRRRFLRAFARHDNGGSTSESYERQRWREIVQEVFAELPDAGGALFDQLWRHFADAKHWTVYQDVERVWEAIGSSGRTIGIASNFDERLHDVCRDLEPLRQANHIFCSSQIAYSKPHPEFFARVQAALGFDAHEILLVGDDWQADFRGARNAGWQALLIDRCRGGPRGHVIHRLDEVVRRIGCIRRHS